MKKTSKRAILTKAQIKKELARMPKNEILFVQNSRGTVGFFKIDGLPSGAESFPGAHTCDDLDIIAKRNGCTPSEAMNKLVARDLFARRAA